MYENSNLQPKVFHSKSDSNDLQIDEVTTRRYNEIFSANRDLNLNNQITN